jgi:hypothetical protein
MIGIEKKRRWNLLINTEFVRVDYEGHGWCTFLVKRIVLDVLFVMFPGGLKGKLNLFHMYLYRPAVDARQLH